MNEPMNEIQKFRNSYGVYVDHFDGSIRSGFYDVQMSTKSPAKGCEATLHVTCRGAEWHPVGMNRQDLLVMRSWIDKLLDDGTNWPGIAAER